MTPLAILKEIVLEAGYDPGSVVVPFPSNQNWHRLEIIDRSFINRHLRFVVAINNDGRVWSSKGHKTKEFRANVHDPNSIKVIVEELQKIREFHAINTK